MQSKKHTILLVDDDYDYLYQQRFILEKEGFTIISADTQKEAEKIIAKERPDLAIFDLMLENQDSGFVLSYKLKKLYPDVPVIITTSVSAETGITFGLNTEEDKKWIKADLYLEKGLNRENFLKEVKKLLDI